jgi:elongator complex protein 3
MHWMPNLLGATVQSDRSDFHRLWSDRSLRPDELKIYPCALLADTPLYAEWRCGNFQPYDEETLIQLVADCKAIVPPYCRINRITRDIPAPNIVSGNTKANLRQLVQNRMADQTRVCRCIRCREVRHEIVEPTRLLWETLVYPTDVTLEYFLTAVTPGRKLGGFLRLSLPKRVHRAHCAQERSLGRVFDEIANCAMIRQVQVFGPALSVGANSSGEAQHTGIGQHLIRQARSIARAEGYRRLVVIASTGTRDYYRRRGFELGELYMATDL